MVWRLYYHDQTTYSSEDGPWSEAPAWGVMGVAHLDDWVGYERDTGDFYVFAPWAGYPWACDHWGLMDLLLQTGHLKPNQRLTDLTAEELAGAGVKFGRSLSNDQWAKVQEWMVNDFPRKSGRYRQERP